MRILLHTAVLAASLFAARDAAAQDCADARVQAEIAEHRRELGTQAVECTRAARADLDGDGRADAVLEISWEGAGGGNNWGSSVFVLLGDAGAPLLEEPEADRGLIDSVTVAGRDIRVQTLEYAEGDGRCCPSAKGEFVLRVDGRRLVRVQPRASVL